MASTPRCVSSFMRIVRASCPVCSRSARGYRDPGVGNYTSTGNGFNFSHSSSNSSSSSADHSSSSSFSGGAAFFGNSGNKFPFNFQAGGQAPSFDFHSLFAGGQVPTPGAHASSAGNEGAPFSTQLSPADSQGSFSQEQGSQGSQSAAGTSAGIRPHGSGSPVNTQDSPSIIVTTPNRSTVTPPSVGVQFTTDNPGSSTAASTVYFQSTTFAPEGSTHKSAVTAVTPIDLDYLDHSVGTQDSSIQLETGSQTYQNGEHSLTDLQQSQSRADGKLHLESETPLKLLLLLALLTLSKTQGSVGFPSNTKILQVPPNDLQQALKVTCPSEFQVGTSDSSVQAVVPSSGVQSDVSFSLSGSETSAPDFHFDTGFSSNQDYDTQESSYSEQPNTQSGIPDASVNIQWLKVKLLDTRELASVSDSSPSVQRAIVDQQSNIHNSPAKTQGFSGLHSAELGPSITNQEQSFQTEFPGANVDYDTQEAAHGIHQGIFASASDAQENSGNFNRADAFLPNSRDSLGPSRYSHGSATGVQSITHDLQHGTEESQSGHNYGIHGSYSSTTEPSFGVPLDTSASATSGTPTKQASVITANAGTGRFHEETEGDPATANHGLITNIQDPSTGLHSTAFINFGSTVDGDYDLLADSQDLPTGVQGAATAFDFSSTDSQKFDANDHDSHRLSSTDIHAPGTRLTESNNPLLSTDSYTDAQDLFSSPDDHDSAASDQTSDDQFLSATDQFSTDENYLSSDSDNSATDNQFSTEGGQFSFTTNQFPVDYDSPADSQFSSPDYDDSVADSQYSSTGHQLSSTTNQFSSSDNHELDNLFSSDSAADNQFSSSLNQFVPIDNDNRRDSSFDDYDSSKNNQFSSTFSQFSPSDNLDSTATQFTSTDSQFSGSTDSETENQSSAFDKYDSITDNRFESDPNVQFPSDDPDAATENPSSSSDSYDSPVGAHFSASGSQGSLFAFTSSGLASGSTTGYMSHGIKRPSSLGQRSGSGVVGGSGLAGFIVQLTGKGAVHPGVCPTLRKDCAASRSAPRTCLNDSTCRPSEKCCFDTCSAALWVCTPSVLPA
ncbi:hypothetical protein C7M84_019950 [Penaeus vannamei]|uniref:WAP domain-containing protein n=1 Tax=Penaeus vannamei TaxID=6689 RepID=A0A423SDA0_PENVA|nr:hypothetical protein C7M84_019950 [Penaeus vannamei]